MGYDCKRCVRGLRRLSIYLLERIKINEKKEVSLSLILAVILTAFMCGCQARDDEGNTPASVLKSGIEAFKNFDDEGLKKYLLMKALKMVRQACLAIFRMRTEA